MKRFIALLTCVVFVIGAFAQNRLIHGKLTAFHDMPLANVEVVAKKAKTSVLSDSLGQFDLVCMNDDVVIVKAKTFISAKQKVDESVDEVAFDLKFIDTPRNRKIAVGYGYMSERDLTTAITQYEQFMNDFCNYSTIADAISSRFAGVNVQGGAVYIRGVTSTNSNEALYVVDGIPTDYIGNIDPCQVKNISIIKDGSSAIYGARGSNGVVLITLKSGEDQ